MANLIEPDRDWRELLVTKPNKRGEHTVLAVVANVVVILTHDEEWSGVLAYDAFREAVIATRIPPWDKVDMPEKPAAGEWTDADTTRAANWIIRHHGVDVSTGQVEQAIPVVAGRRVVHPVRDWLSSLVWDDKPRIDELFTTYFGADDSGYVRGVAARFMIGAVARVFEPGCKVDCTPVLEGPQGIGKSTGIQKLAGPAWCFDTPITMGEKDGYQALRGKWVGELGELHALSRSDLNRAKNFLTATVDTYRPSYGRRSRDFPRQCVFYGTTNASQYLRDETGNRRFWPIRCGHIDLEAIVADREQLWAEARARYADGERWHVDTAEFRTLCEEQQERRFVVDAWESLIEVWLLAPAQPERRARGVTMGEVMAGALSLTSDKWAKADQDRIAAILRRLDWERGKQARGDDGRRERRWKPKAVTLVPDVGDGAVTRETKAHIPLSPASPADAYVRTQEGIRPQHALGVNGTQGDVSDGDAGGDDGSLSAFNREHGIGGMQ